MATTVITQRFEAALETFDVEDAEELERDADERRSKIIERFPLDSWPTMPLEHYALGVGNTDDSFCWTMEFGSQILGGIGGGSAHKHLIFRNSHGDWTFPDRYPSVEAAWEDIRAGFATAFELATEGRVEEIDRIESVKGARSLLLKALHLYFPDDFTYIYGNKHLRHYLAQLNVDHARIGLPSARVAANRTLLQTLRDDPRLTHLSDFARIRFLYHWAHPTLGVKARKIEPGIDGSAWPACEANGLICLQWGEVGDLTSFTDWNEFRSVFGETFPKDRGRAAELWTMLNLSKGDKIIAARGDSEILGVGTVNDDGYRFRPDEIPDAPHTVGVEWETTTPEMIEPQDTWRRKIVAPVSGPLYRRIAGRDVSAPVVEIDPTYLDIEDALDRRGQVILYGPPGTGKTYAARRSAVWLLRGGSTTPVATDVLDDPDLFASEEHRLSVGTTKSPAAWIMVANPANWRWDQLFEDGTIDFQKGRIAANFPKARTGDLVFGYESTPTKRLVAIARVASPYDPESEELLLEPVTKVSEGLTYAELQGDEILSASEGSRLRFQGTLFALTSTESTHLLRRLIERDPSLEHLATSRSVRLSRVTFHPSFTYEDFIEGYRPQPGSDSGMRLDLVDGIFKTVCNEAAADPDNRYVVLIDEINRGNVPKILGELITIIEKDKRGLTVRLPQSNDELAVPPNVSIIATMNTADRSIHMLDSALRRRFAFVELLPDSTVLTGATVGTLALDRFLDNLNKRIRERFGREKQIGHALLFDEGGIVETPEIFSAIFRHEILPLLQEYLYEDYRDLAGLLGDAIIDIDEERMAPSVLEDPEELCDALAEQFDARIDP